MGAVHPQDRRPYATQVREVADSLALDQEDAIKSKSAARLLATFGIVSLFALLPSLAHALTWTRGPNGVGMAGQTPLYDPHRHTMLVYHSHAELVLSTDTWSALPTPSPNVGGVAVLDPFERRFLIVHGTTGGAVTLYQQRVGQAAVTSIATTGTAPSSAEFRGLFFDAPRSRLLYFRYPNNGWQLDLNVEPPTWSSFSGAGTPPTEIGSGRMAYDPLGDRLLVVTSMNEIKELSLGDTPTWNSIAVSGSGYFGDAAAFDARNNRIAFFGHSTFTCTPFPPCYTTWYNDSYAILLTGTPQWVQLSGNQAGPEGRQYASLMHDPLNDRLVLYGGYKSGYYFNDLWFLGLGNSSAPDLEQPADIEFGTVHEFGSYTASFELSNVGTRPGVVYAIVSDDPTVTVTPRAFSLDAAGTRTIDVTWSPTQFGWLNATIEIESNDPDSPSLVVPVSGGAFPSVDVGGSPARSFALESAGANPARGAASIALTMPARADVDLAVFDLRGSFVRRLTSGERGAGRHALTWDGTNAAGRAMGAGIYFVRATSGGKSTAVKIALAR